MQIFKDKTKDEAWLARYETALAEAGAVHKLAVDWIIDNLPFTDERAIQAAAFTIRKDALDRVNNPNMVYPGENEKIRNALVEIGSVANKERRLERFASLVCLLEPELDRDHVLEYVGAPGFAQSVNNGATYEDLADLLIYTYCYDVAEEQEKRAHYGRLIVQLGNEIFKDPDWREKAPWFGLT